MIKPYYERDGITIYCGDCRVILSQFEDGAFDMVFTDPPYGHNNNNGDLIQSFQRPGDGTRGYCKGDGRPIENDGPEANELYREILPELYRLLGPGCCCCCCCGGGGPNPQFARWALWMDEVFQFKQMIVWDKGQMGMGWHYRRSYETFLVGEKPGAACRWFDDTKAIENIIRPGDYGIRKIIPSADDHPTPKPVELAAHFIKLHTLPDDVVLDPFMGGGSTLVAAWNLGRRAVGIEISEEYCAMAVERLRQRSFFSIGLDDELKETYFKQAVQNLEMVEKESVYAPTLFDISEF